MEKEKEIRKIDEGIKLGPEKREIKLEVKGIKIEVEDKEINKFEEEGIKNEIAEEEEEGELFYFESDHLALRGNRDYSEVLKTIFILESIRKRAIKDYEIVAQLHKKALEDPVSFNEKIKNDESLGLPVMFNVPAIPNIDWQKYDVPVPESVLKDLKEEMDPESNINNFEDLQKSSSISESNTHSKPWTSEEQRRLEELLVIYPPEPIELRRFKKIAAALGNRTVKQVTSRVQKYFQRLYKAGLPIPGRIPKSIHDRKKIHKHQRFNRFLWKPSTFFPEYDVPVKMNEPDDNTPGPSGMSPAPTTSNLEVPLQNNYLLPGSYQEEFPEKNTKSNMELQLELLKRIKHEKQREYFLEDQPHLHYGYRCDFCEEEPISGSRWHCISCVKDSIDFCTDCVLSQLNTSRRHPLNHDLVVIRRDDEIESYSGDSSNDQNVSIKNFNMKNNDIERGKISGSKSKSFERNDMTEIKCSKNRTKEGKSKIEDCTNYARESKTTEVNTCNGILNATTNVNDDICVKRLKRSENSFSDKFCDNLVEIKKEFILDEELNNSVLSNYSVYINEEDIKKEIL